MAQKLVHARLKCVNWQFSETEGVNVLGRLNFFEQKKHTVNISNSQQMLSRPSASQKFNIFPLVKWLSRHPVQYTLKRYKGRQWETPCITHFN